MTIYVAAHALDPDGIFSHALVQRYARNQGTDQVEPFLANHALIPGRPEIITTLNALELIADREPGQVIVADLDFSDNLSNDLIKRIARKHDYCDWYDHHIGTKQHQSTLGALGFGVTQDQHGCAAQLVAKDLGLQTPYDRALAKIANVHDYLCTSHELWAVAQATEDIISSGFSLLQLISDLSEERVFNSNLTDLSRGYGGDVLQDYLAKVTIAIGELTKDYTIKTVSGKSVAVVVMDPVLYMKRGMREFTRILSDPELVPSVKPDFAVFFTRGINNPVMEGYTGARGTVPSFCKILNGGGRENRGGFSLPNKIFKQPVDKQWGYVKNKLEEFLDE